MDEIHFECLIAAILTVGTSGPSNTVTNVLIDNYARTLERLREAGGPIRPRKYAQTLCPDDSNTRAHGHQTYA
jgi:hypothetical protein